MESATKSIITGLGYGIVGAAIEVHDQLGPGLLEKIYEECLAEELALQGFVVERQVEVPITYKEKRLRQPLKLDLLVSRLIVVEVKAVERILPVHQAQLLSYMKLARKPKGILINFHTDRIVHAVVHRVNEYYRVLPDGPPRAQ